MWLLYVEPLEGYLEDSRYSLSTEQINKFLLKERGMGRNNEDTEKREAERKGFTFNRRRGCFLGKRRRVCSLRKPMHV